MVAADLFLMDRYKVNSTTGAIISQGAGPGGSALTVAQSRAQLSMWALLKSPLLVSADFDEVAKCKAHDRCWHLGCTHPRAPAIIVRAGPTDPKAPQKGSGAELIAVLKNTEVLEVSDDPLGMEAVRLEDAGGHSSPDVFLGQMAGGKFAAVLFNRNGAANMTLKLSDTKVVNPAAAASHYRVRDLWSHTENGTVAADGELTVMVGAQDVAMVTLTPA